MGEDSTRPAPLEAAKRDYLLSRGKGRNNQSGTYRRNAERELDRFIAYLDRQGIERLAAIDATVLRDYVRTELLDRDVRARTVRKYYDYVSAWIGWAQREGRVAEHYGIQETARELLPEPDTRKEARQQSWTREQRRAILRFVDEQARAAIAADGTDAYQSVRDRAMVYTFAYTGLRASELLANSQDDRRVGARWDDLDANFESILVLGKTQDWETRSVPPQARPALERWETVYDPEPDWPVIPTLHYPSLYETLRAAGVEDTSGFDGYGEIFERCREVGATPPALTTDGARRLLRSLTDSAGIDVDEGYLELHGARRGVGRVLAKEKGADPGARQLGNSVRVFEERYADVLAAEQAEETGEAFEQHDG